MKASEIFARVNGVSTPLGRVSWIPSVPDVVVAKEVIAFIEMRRVLFSTYADEVPEQCVGSVIEIRNFFTEVIGQGGIGDDLEQPVRLARRYCVRFLERAGGSQVSAPKNASDSHLFRVPRCQMHDYWFGEALGELRAGVGLQAGIIAARYKTGVEDDLAGIIPSLD